MGNLGVALIHLGRPTEALHNFEQILDATDNPAELWASYDNIGGIYEDWGKPQLAALYRQKANKLSAEAQTRLAQYEPQRASGDKLVALADAIMNAEIELKDGNTLASASPICTSIFLLAKQLRFFVVQCRVAVRRFGPGKRATRYRKR